MSTEYEQIKDIARASLLPDFFAVRIDEEGLFGKMQEMVAKVTFPTPIAGLDQIKQITAAAADPNALIEALKAKNLWTMTREILTKVKVS